MKICTTDQFREIAQDSIAREFNRLPSDELLERLDPDGWHVMYFSMPHEHVAGHLADLHWRTLWMMKIAGTMLPAEVAIDMTTESFEKLADHAPQGS